METATARLVLCVDDDPDVHRVLRDYLTDIGCQLVTSTSGCAALRLAQFMHLMNDRRPDLLLVDANLPDMSGYEFCAQIRGIVGYAPTPVVFLSSLHTSADGERARQGGGQDYLPKPIEKGALLAIVEKYGADLTASEPASSPVPQEEGPRTTAFKAFKEFVLEQADDVGPEEEERVRAVGPLDPYALAPILRVPTDRIASWAAEYLHLPYQPSIIPDAVAGGVLRPVFCIANLVVPVFSQEGKPRYVVANPFNWNLLESLDRGPWADRAPDFAVAEPRVILGMFSEEAPAPPPPPRSRARRTQEPPPPSRGIPSERHSMTRKIFAGSNGSGGAAKAAPCPVIDPLGAKNATRTLVVTDAAGHARGMVVDKPGPDLPAQLPIDHPILQMADDIVREAVLGRASDIHFDPKSSETVVRFRVDGEMLDLRTLENEQAMMVISRLKALAGLNIAERRKPQDGVVEASIEGRRFRLRLATTSTPNGESLVVRLLEPSRKPLSTDELGMSEAQGREMHGLIARSQGLILFVGTTGSGKSTTIYSLLSQIDSKSRCVLSVEDPIEYEIMRANQQQVHEKAGVTWEALLKSAMRQDPDVLFLGEIRDPMSARASMDFASSGHLTISTMHAANSTIAIFRLERLGVQRATLAEALLVIVGQKLMRVLCPKCKKIEPITVEEASWLTPFTEDVPETVANPVGCDACKGTGYYGRTGLFEMLPFDPELVEMVRGGAPIPRIRAVARDHGHFLISSHAVDKVREGLISPRDAQLHVLVEEQEVGVAARRSVSRALSVPAKECDRPSILVVDDDGDACVLLQRCLESRGYSVVVSRDGVEAIMQLSRRNFGLVLMDVGLPDLDGSALVDALNRKGIRAAVLLMSGLSEDELTRRNGRIRSVEVIRKPIDRELLLERVGKAVQGPEETPIWGLSQGEDR